MSSTSLTADSDLASTEAHIAQQPSSDTAVDSSTTAYENSVFSTVGGGSRKCAEVSGKDAEVSGKDAEGNEDPNAAVLKILSTSGATLLINVFEFPFLTESECQGMTETILANRYGRFQAHETSMQKHTVDVTQILGSAIHDRILKDLYPTINLLFDFNQPQPYHLYSAHAVIYSASGEGEKALALHVDDCDITVNLTIHAINLTGSDLTFRNTTPYGNEFCHKHYDKKRLQNENKITVAQIPTTKGNCILHRGNHQHFTTKIVTGERIALILWLKKNVVNPDST